MCRPTLSDAPAGRVRDTHVESEVAVDSILLAYIDPGAGTILLQMLIGSLVGIVVFFRQTLTRIFGLGRRDDSTCSASTEEPRQG